MRTKFSFFILSFSIVFYGFTQEELQGGRTYERSDIYNKNLEELLNKQLSSYQINFSSLVNSRGLSEPYTELNTQIVFDFIKKYPENELTKKYTAVVFYHFSEDTLYIWGLSHKLCLYKQNIKQSYLLELEQSLKNCLVGQEYRGGELEETPEDSLKDFNSISRQLGELLFPLEFLNQFDDNEHFLIVPCLNIGSIPLYALKPNPISDEYMVDLKTLTIAHSFNHFLSQVEYQTHKLYLNSVEMNSFMVFQPLVVGNPSFEGCSDEFEQLKGAQDETQFAANKLNAKLLTGKKATKTAFLEQVDNSSIIYVATHGYSDAEDPVNKSFLVFSGKSKKNCEFLTAKEIQSDTLMPNSLVVLSACQTGLGKVMDAGIVGIGRAFLIAGASNVVISLWNVGDKETQELMRFFTDELFLPKEYLTSRSLRNAMLKYKEINPNPYAWASFIAMGMPIGVMSAYEVENDH